MGRAVQVAVQKLWTEPRRLEGKYPASADAGDKHWVSLHWLMSEVCASLPAVCVGCVPAAMRGLTLALRASPGITQQR